MLTGRAHPLPVVMLAVSIALGMSGCVAPTPDPTPSTSAAPSASPLFDSDEEALAAATEAYAAFQSAVDAEFMREGKSELDELAIDPALTEARADIEAFHSEGKTQTGSVVVRAAKLESRSPGSAGLPPDSSIRVYVCLDVSAVNVLDRSGQSTVKADRPVAYPFVVTAAWSQAQNALVVEGDEVWEGENFCD